jgi:DNA-binding PadR family transcriptional regulator
MVGPAPTVPFIAFASDRIPMGAMGLLIDLSGRVKEGRVLHDDTIVSVEFAFAKVCVIIQRLNFGAMEPSNDNSRELTLLEQVEHDPDVNQSTLATQLGVAVGTVNWHLKRLIAKGYVKVQRAERKKLRYIITPEGIALRARLTVDYIERSFDLYRKTRRRIKEHLDVVRAAGFNRVRVLGEGDVADICRLSCLEQGFTVVQDPDVPALELKGWKVILNMGDRT